ncbi:MAG: MurR/RpiR family transcriptional regulator, partial [Planctomycetaceae bacterium]|nr:MurR/RpiR family transcriptional regulator [Planctomycetaceae bacterium]
SRFCRRLGYKGYNAFKLAVANSAAQPNAVSPLSGAVVPTDIFKDMCLKVYSADLGAMTETLELIREESIVRAADLLENANKVLCMGQGGSMILAKETAHLFSTAGGNYFAVEDSHMQAISAAGLCERDVVMFFSYSGATIEMAHTMKVAKERGAKIILITRFPKSPSLEN